MCLLIVIVAHDFVYMLRNGCNIQRTCKFGQYCCRWWSNIFWISNEFLLNLEVFLQYLQSLATLLGARSIFSFCIVLWVHMRHSSVTIVVHWRNNDRRPLLYIFMTMSQLWKLNYCWICASRIISNIKSRCSVCVIEILLGRLISDFKLWINILCC